MLGFSRLFLNRIPSADPWCILQGQNLSGQRNTSCFKTSSLIHDEAFPHPLVAPKPSFQCKAFKTNGNSEYILFPGSHGHSPSPVTSVLGQQPCCLLTETGVSSSDSVAPPLVCTTSHQPLLLSPLEPVPMGVFLSTVVGLLPPLL